MRFYYATPCFIVEQRPSPRSLLLPDADGKLGKSRKAPLVLTS